MLNKLFLMMLTVFAIVPFAGQVSAATQEIKANDDVAFFGWGWGRGYGYGGYGYGGYGCGGCCGGYSSCGSCGGYGYGGYGYGGCCY